MPSAFDGQLPNGWDDCGECKKPARLNASGMCEKCADDLQVWLRHGRIGRGRTYQQEVERARRIEAEHSSVPRGTGGLNMAEFMAAPWCIPPGSETCVCAGDDGTKPGKILFVLRGPSGTREVYSHELLAEYSSHIAQAVNSHDALVKALEEIAGASQSEATSRLRRLAQEALASVQRQGAL